MLSTAEILQLSLATYLDVEIKAKGKGKGNGKSIPVRAWTDPEGSRKLRHPDFKTVDT